MKIVINKAIVEFKPETQEETAYLEALWIKMGNCIGDNKKLSPIGVYQPTEDNTAKFYIEGLNEEEVNSNTVVKAPYDCEVYCSICNKIVNVKKGDDIPYCCGRLMEIID
jgi:hypothetical protein